MELGGFEPPTSWVRSAAAAGVNSSRKPYFQGVSVIPSVERAAIRVPNMRGYAAMCSESGTSGEKFPKSRRVVQSERGIDIRGLA